MLINREGGPPSYLCRALFNNERCNYFWRIVSGPNPAGVLKQLRAQVDRRR